MLRPEKRSICNHQRTPPSSSRHFMDQQARLRRLRGRRLGAGMRTGRRGAGRRGRGRWRGGSSLVLILRLLELLGMERRLLIVWLCLPKCKGRMESFRRAMRWNLSRKRAWLMRMRWKVRLLLWFCRSSHQQLLRGRRDKKTMGGTSNQKQISYSKETRLYYLRLTRSPRVSHQNSRNYRRCKWIRAAK